MRFTGKRGIVTGGAFASFVTGAHIAVGGRMPAGALASGNRPSPSPVAALEALR
jgi:hypothetical protein